MKYYLMLFVGLGLSLDAVSQSTLYQTSPQYPLDHQTELFEKQLFLLPYTITPVFLRRI
ncbi:hypothetical protein V8V91_00400 [Algoriphagus halophilus]|uniref:hypothetical protein n=1 Tax=Algoriphagus halophilus TaxID=226505 RepID=UPI00358E18E0